MKRAPFARVERLVPGVGLGPYASRKRWRRGRERSHKGERVRKRLRGDTDDKSVLELIRVSARAERKMRAHGLRHDAAR
jgi:hypothetical protein